MLYVGTKEVYVRKYNQESKQSMIKILNKLGPDFLVYTLYYEY